MKSLKQIIKEFWFPFLVALFWMFYNFSMETRWSLVHAINIFGPTFFLMSWCTGQYFRIRKQNKVDDELDKIQNKLTSFFQQLEDKTENIIGNLTGGDSFCYWFITNINSDLNQGLEVTLHDGKYPLFNAQARIVDIDKLAAVTDPNYNDIKACTIIRSFISLIPGHSISGEVLRLGDGDKISFNIFWTASNGSFNQILRYRKIGNEWCWATKVTRGNKLLYENIQKDFPRNEKNEADW